MTAKNTELLWDKCSTNAILAYCAKLHSVNVRTDLQLMRPDHICPAGIPPGMKSQSGKFPTSKPITGGLYTATHDSTDALVTALRVLHQALVFGVTASVATLLGLQRKTSSVVLASSSWFHFMWLYSHHIKWPVVPVFPECRTFSAEIKVVLGKPSQLLTQHITKQ